MNDRPIDPLLFPDIGPTRHGDAVDADQVSAQLMRANRRLRFPDPQLEAGFRRFLEQYTLIQVRPALLVLMAFIGLFGLTDLVNFPPEVARITLGIRFGLVVPVLVWSFWLTYRLDAGSQLHRSQVFAAVVSGLGILLMIYVPHSAGFHSPYEGLMLFMFGFGGFMGVRFVHATVILLLMAMLYIAGEVAAGMPAAFFINSGFRVVSTAIVSAGAAYVVERQARDVYLQRVLLDTYAHRDGLTGIANRRAFDAHAARVVQQAARDGKPISVMIIDADYFKQYNDTYGHSMGDACLKQIAAAITQSARRPFDLAARYGGEEFVLLLFDVGVDESLGVASALQARIASLALPHAGSPIADSVTVSGGIGTSLAGDPRPFEELLKAADQALYQAKASGRNRFVHPSVGPLEPQAFG